MKALPIDFKYVEDEFPGLAKQKKEKKAPKERCKFTLDSNLLVEKGAEGEGANTGSNSSAGNGNEDSEVSDLFGTHLTCTYKCLKCNEEKTQNKIWLVSNLVYPVQVREDCHVPFTQILKQSLTIEKTLQTWCEVCKKYSPTNQYTKVSRLPKLLTVNCGLDNEKDLEFLMAMTTKGGTGGTATDQSSAPKVEPTLKLCRYGVNCSRLDCRFMHPDRKTSESGTATTSSAASSMPATPTAQQKANTWFPMEFHMEIVKDGKLEVTLNEEEVKEEDGGESGEDKEENSKKKEKKSDKVKEQKEEQATTSDGGKWESQLILLEMNLYVISDVSLERLRCCSTHQNEKERKFQGSLYYFCKRTSIYSSQRFLTNIKPTLPPIQIRTRRTTSFPRSYVKSMTVATKTLSH